MKVGFLIDDHMDRPGGVQEYVRGLGGFLRSEGHEVVVFSSGGVAGDGLRVVALGRKLPLRGSGSTTSVPLALQTPAGLRSRLQREACDVMHVMAPYSPTLSGRLLLRSPAAHVLTFLVAIEPGLYRALLGSLARLQTRSLRTIDERIAISSAAAATGRALYGGTYRIIPCGVDTARFAPGLDPLPGLDGENLLYLGRLEQRKGVAHLMRAFALLLPQRRSLRLLIAGDGPERRALEQLAATLGVREQVRFLGYVPAETLPRLLASAAVFCAPATYAESFGIVLIEAMAAGLPVVAAANMGYAGLLEQHAGNLLTPPGDHRAMAGALESLLQSPRYRQELGRRNHAAAGRYAWSVVGREVVAVYEGMLGRAFD